MWADTSDLDVVQFMHSVAAAVVITPGVELAQRTQRYTLCAQRGRTMAQRAIASSWEHCTRYTSARTLRADRFEQRHALTVRIVCAYGLRQSISTAGIKIAHRVRSTALQFARHSRLHSRENADAFRVLELRQLICTHTTLHR